VPLLASLDLIEEVGMPAIRAKSIELTSYALTLVDAWLVPLGAVVTSPRATDQRGGHVTVRREGFSGLLEQLWAAGVLPDYRQPDAIRIGLSPLSTSFLEVHDGLRLLADLTAAL
jgi:kynureninase